MYIYCVHACLCVCGGGVPAAHALLCFLHSLGLVCSFYRYVLSSTASLKCHTSQYLSAKSLDLHRTSHKLPNANFTTAKTHLQIPDRSSRSHISQQRSTSDPAFSHTVELKLTLAPSTCMYVYLRPADTSHAMATWAMATWHCTMAYIWLASN